MQKIKYCLEKIHCFSFFNWLKNSLVLFERDSKNKILILSNTASIFTIIATLLGGYSLWFAYVSLQVSGDVPLKLFPKYYVQGQDPAFIHATSSEVKLRLKNNFLGSVENIQVYSEYIYLLQDKNNFDSIWTCIYRFPSVYPIASSTIIKRKQYLEFSLNYKSKYDQKFIDQYQNSVNFISLIRIIVDFNKKVDSVPQREYFYYEVFDGQTLTVFDGAILPISIRNKYGVLDRSEVLNLINKKDISSQDSRCFPFIYFKNQ